jgi:hypothetical protein
METFFLNLKDDLQIHHISFRVLSFSIILTLKDNDTKITKSSFIKNVDICC